MNKKIILASFTFACFACITNAYDAPSQYHVVEMPKKQYEELVIEKNRQIRFLEESQKKSEADETGFTKTNVGLGTIALGIVCIVVGMHKKNLPISVGGGLTIGAGGFLAYTASKSRRDSEKLAREQLRDATKGYDDLMRHIKVTN